MPLTKRVSTEKFSSDGGRLTPIRAALLTLLEKRREPQTPQELVRALSRRGRSVNKTTVYRQLEALQKQGIIREVRFADRSSRYELADDDHHHHLVCVVCGRIEDVELPTDLAAQEKIILKKSGFKVLEHSLEFFGRCRKCQTH